MTFQVISQTKLLSAAIFSVWRLDRKLAPWQWVSLALLTLGVLLAQAEGKMEQAPHDQNVPLGVFACVLSGLSSSFAGVYFEKVVKTTSPTLSVRNIHLSIFGVPFAVLSMIVLDVLPSDNFDYWQGYNPLTCTLIVVHALGGLLVAVVVKYADNILKGFATGVAIIVSGAFTWVFWGFVPSKTFVLGCILVIGSSIMYHYADPATKKAAAASASGQNVSSPVSNGEDVPGTPPSVSISIIEARQASKSMASPSKDPEAKKSEATKKSRQ